MENDSMKFLRVVAVSGALAISAVGCADLDVPNMNSPERDRALAAPGDVQSLISGSFRTWWISQKSYESAGLSLSVMAWEHSSSHGNARMWISSRMPREAIPVHPSEPDANTVEDPWYLPYRAIVAASEGLAAMDAGLEMPEEAGSDTQARARAWARFVQGVGHGTIGLLFDRGFVMDETVDAINSPPPLVPYTEVMAAALGYLDEAIALAEANTFKIPSTWLNGLEYDNTDLAKVAHSYRARFMAQVARTPAERAAVDWEKVIAHAEKGVEETFAPISNWSTWWDEIQYYGTLAAWSQMSYRHFGRGDISGGYQEWMATDWNDRVRFLMVTPDKRWPQGETAEEQAKADNRGKYFQYVATQPFQVARGLYYPSFYRDYRFDGPYVSQANKGPMTEIEPEEMWALQAEGHIRLNRPEIAAELINKSRVESGGLPPVTAAGVPGGDSCVPKMIDGSCGDLMEAMKWEKRNETRFTAFGGFYFDNRGWGDLDPGTALHWPIPGKELQVLQMDLYSFGGGVDPEWEAALVSGDPVEAAGARLQMQNSLQVRLQKDFDGRRALDARRF
jgi:hypothetical protein